MLSLKDCLDFCGVDCCEIEAIAEHEHIPLIIAAGLSNQLLQSPEGIRCLHLMLQDGLQQAIKRGDKARAQQFDLAYQHVKAAHPLQASTH